MKAPVRRPGTAAVALLAGILLLICGLGRASGQGSQFAPARGPASPRDSACIRVPPAATGVRSMRDLARVVMSTYGQFEGRSFPIFIARVRNPPPDWLVALAGVDEDGSSSAGEREINNWLTAFGLRAHAQPVRGIQ